MRARCADPLEDVVRCFAAAGDERRIDAHDRRAVPAARHLGGLPSDPGAAAEKVDAQSATPGALEEPGNEVGPGDLFRQARAEELRGPEKRLAVDEGKARALVRGAKRRRAGEVTHGVAVRGEKR